MEGNENDDDNRRSSSTAENAAAAAADEMFPIEFQIMGHTIDENKKKRLTPEWPSSNGIAYMSCISKMILSRIRLTIN